MSRIILAVGLALAALAPIAPAQTVIYSEGFENGLANWTATGLWHALSDTTACGAAQAPFPEGNVCAYYGIDAQCNFDTGTGTAGTLQLVAPIAIPTGFQSVKLHCWMKHDTEPCGPSFGYDDCTILVSANGGGTWTAVAARCVAKFGPPPNIWNPRSIDLSAYAGQSVLLRIDFDSIDGFFNDGAGVLLDRIVIQGESGQPSCTETCPCEGPFNPTWVPLVAQGGFTGCGNSFHRQGQLAGSGTTSVSNDLLTLRAIDLPPSAIALLVQGDTTSMGAWSGEGRFCLGGSLLRMGIVTASNGVVSYPIVGNPALSVTGLIPPGGGTRGYQVRYRDISNTYCNASNFNWSNGYTIVWSP